MLAQAHFIIAVILMINLGVSFVLIFVLSSIYKALTDYRWRMLEKLRRILRNMQTIQELRKHPYHMSRVRDIVEGILDEKEIKGIGQDE